MRARDVHALERLVHLILHLVIHLIEVVVREDVVDGHSLLIVGVVLGAIDIHVQMAIRVAGNGEGLRAVVALRLSVATNRRVRDHGDECPLSRLTREVNLRLHTIFRVTARVYSLRRIPRLHFCQREDNARNQRTGQSDCRVGIADAFTLAEVVNLGGDGEVLRE